MQKRYSVCLHHDVDWNSFWYDMENPTTGLSHVPDRIIDIDNNIDGMDRICYYMLTDEEATELRNDSRVSHVDIPPEDNPNLQIVKCAVQNGNFNKPAANTFSSGDWINWGLVRGSSSTNVFGANTLSPKNYDYVLDGTGVDVVIMDSGIEASHPEFRDANGANRVQQIDWFTSSGVSGTQDANHYRDYDGHGTQVAGIAAGKTYGWAKNARIYSTKLSGLEGSGDSGTGISLTYIFQVIKGWHLRKPNDPRTGLKRPTIVNMSWGINNVFSAAGHPITGMMYRGSSFGGLPSSYFTTDPIDYVYRFAYLGLYPYQIGSNYLVPSRDGTIDTGIQELIDAGVHVVTAAGNNFMKRDVLGGVDYNNTYTTSGGTYYYHRGASPYDDEAITVGALDSTTYNANLDQKTEFSSFGPAVTIYAPGQDIMSAVSNTNIHSGNVYYKNASFKQVLMGGTSQAAPQVTGMCATYLQANPGISVAQLKNWLTSKSYTNSMYTTDGTAAGASTGWVPDWFNYRTTFGAPAKVIYNNAGGGAIKGNTSITSSITGGLSLTNGVLTLT